jgi:stage II sporulation protein R
MHYALSAAGGRNCELICRRHPPYTVAFFWQYIAYIPAEDNPLKSKYILAVAAFFLVAVFAAGCVPCGQAGDTAYLRIHVRANSNAAADQDVKYLVKEAVVDYLAPLLVSVFDFDQCRRVIEKNLSGIERTADAVLKGNGLSYTARARLTAEAFPARAYGDLVLESGLYDALILELGAGDGDNWWCVVYPPLCFTDAKGTTDQGITYRSLIAKWIDAYKSKR